MAPPPAMTNYTYAFGDDTGYVLNIDNAQTVPFFDVTDVSGLDSAPARSDTAEHQGTDGTYVDAPFMSMRTIVITGDMYTDPGDPETILNQLKHDYGVGQGIKPFYYQVPGQIVKFLNCLGGGVKFDQDTNRSIGKTAGVQMTLFAGDPYIYDYPPNQSQVGFPTIPGGIGMGFNVAFNMGFGGNIPGSSATVTNYGTHTAYPILTLVGPLVNPVVVDSVNGITMAFAISLQATDSMVVNCKNRSVVLNGTVSRRSTLSGLRWFSVPAGASESVSLYADSGTGSLLVTLYNTYY